MDSDSSAEHSTLHPDGWVGNPAELERARFYRSAQRWGAPVFYLVLATSFFVDSPFDLAMIGVMVVWVALIFFFQSAISRAIGRKWTSRLEYKEKRQREKQLPRSRAEIPPDERWSHDVAANEDHLDHD